MNMKRFLIIALILGFSVFVISCGGGSNGNSGNGGNGNGYYSVTFNTNGGSGVNNLDGVRSIPTEPLPTKAGHIFGGWYANEGLTGHMLFFPYNVTADTVLHARWVAEPGYTVTFNTNGGDPLQNMVGVARIVIAPVAIRYWYIFTGWTNSAGTKLRFPYAVNDNITLYAEWEPELLTK